MDTGVPDFQLQLATALQAIFVDVPIETEWSSMHGHNGVYSPRLDVAVGPFAIDHLVCIDDFNALARTHSDFVRLLYEMSVENCREFGEPTASDLEEVLYRNANSRCFLAIEVENKVSRKHLMGGAINAAALGRVGVAIGWTRDKVKAFVKLRSYLLYLASVGKNTFHPYNLLVLDREQVLHAIVLHKRNLRRERLRNQG